MPAVTDPPGELMKSLMSCNTTGIGGSEHHRTMNPIARYMRVTCVCREFEWNVTLVESWESKRKSWLMTASAEKSFTCQDTAHVSKDSASSKGFRLPLQEAK